MKRYGCGRSMMLVEMVSWIDDTSGGVKLFWAVGNNVSTGKIIIVIIEIVFDSTRDEYGHILQYERFKLLGGNGTSAACCWELVCVFGDAWAAEMARATDAHLANVVGGLREVIGLASRAFFMNRCECVIIATGHQDLLGTDTADVIFEHYRQLAAVFDRFPFVNIYILHPLYSTVYEDKWLLLRGLLAGFDQWPQNVTVIGATVDNAYGWSWSQLCCIGKSEASDLFSNGSVSVEGARRLIQYLHDVCDLPVQVSSLALDQGAPSGYSYGHGYSRCGASRTWRGTKRRRFTR
jgi:hypothetical protein